jgi:hypothetical protein
MLWSMISKDARMHQVRIAACLHVCMSIWKPRACCIVSLQPRIVHMCVPLQMMRLVAATSY